MSIKKGSVVFLRSEQVLPAGERTYMTVIRTDNPFPDNVVATWMDADHHYQRAIFPLCALVEIVPDPPYTVH